ncbi:MAG: ABC transporter permease subunit [Tissierellia bacterium]|nr:ABC transporter permease subunit [Tissierellia bacterium]
MNIFKFEIKRNQKTALLWTLISGFFVFLFMALFPSMKNSGIQEFVVTKFDAFPKEFMTAFGVDSAVNFDDIMHYTAYTLQYIIMAMAVYGILLGFDSLLIEETQGTIEFLYAQPTSRKKIFWSKVLSHGWLLFQSLFLLGMITFLSAVVFKPDNLAFRTLGLDMAELFLGSLFVCFLYFFLGVFIGSIMHTKSSGLALGIFFLSYIVGILSRIKEDLSFMRYFAPFDYALPMDIVRQGWDLKYIFVGAVAMIVLLFSSFFLYQKKNFRI